MKWLLSVLLMLPLLALALGPGGPSQSAKQETAVLHTLQLQQQLAGAAFKRHPKDAGLKQKYVFATMKLGMKTMYAETLTPHVKYTTAWRLFKEVLRVDPKNKDAKEQKDMIDAVYRSMGKRPGG